MVQGEKSKLNLSFFAIKTKKDYDFSFFTIVNSMEFHYPKGFSDKKCLYSKLWYPKVGGAKYLIYQRTKKGYFTT